MTIEVLDPTYDGDTSSFKYAAGLKNLKGATVGIISNGKKGTFHFFNALEDLLIKKYRQAIPYKKGLIFSSSQSAALNRSPWWTK